MRDGSPPQTNIVRVDGQRAALLTVMKSGNASTLDIVNADQGGAAAHRRPACRRSCEIKPLADQSLFVRAAIEGVLREASSPPCLTALMILLFLGSWRSTLIIAVSIPLSILSSIIVLSALGETINIMTLGGLALAVGILVDDATVAIENINWHLEQGKALEPAILDGAEQIAVPAFVSTLCICIVFVPMFFLTRRRALPLRAAGRGGGLRDARVVRPVADAGADDGEVPAEGARAARTTAPRVADLLAASSARSTAASSGCATATARRSSSA